jgi:hypothetical protein
VLRRDGYRCRIRYEGICIGEATIVDHIRAIGLGGADDDANCQAMRAVSQEKRRAKAISREVTGSDRGPPYPNWRSTLSIDPKR